MDHQGKRRVMIAGGGIALAAMVLSADPIADVRVTHDVTAPAISRIEAKIDVGLVAFSFLHSWKRALR